MLFVLHRLDDPDRTGLRLVHREAHIAHLHRHTDKILLGGPLRDDADSRDLGSMFLLDCASLEEARAFAMDDP